MKRNKSEIIFKLDFKKVDDRVNWDFLWFIMSRMGFGENWTKWIMRCVICVKVSVLVNGSLSPSFNMECSLRQECPLSHLLFNLVVEALPRLLNQVESVG